MEQTVKEIYMERKRQAKWEVVLWEGWKGSLTEPKMVDLFRTAKMMKRETRCSRRKIHKRQQRRGKYELEVMKRWRKCFRDLLNKQN